MIIRSQDKLDAWFTPSDYLKNPNAVFSKVSAGRRPFFCHGHKVDIWSLLMHECAQFSDPYIFFRDFSSSSSDTTLRDLLCAKGHFIGDRDENFDKSLARCRQYILLAQELLATRANTFSTPTLNKAELSFEEASLHHFLRKKGELSLGVPQLSNAPNFSLVSDMLENNSIALPLKVELIPFQTKLFNDHRKVVHFPSPLNAFLMFSNDWLDGFDNAMQVAWKTCASSANYNPSSFEGLAFGLRWTLDLRPYWQSICIRKNITRNVLFSHLNKLAPLAILEGQSASCAFGAASFQLLERAQSIGKDKLNAVANDFQNVITLT